MTRFERPAVSDFLDYEGELGFVIGRRCRHVRAQDAADVIAGYLIVDDVSVRDWQIQTPQWSLAKSFDTHGPIGPWITTRRRARRPARARHPHVRQRRAAPAVQHRPADLRLLPAGRDPLAGVHAGARRRDRHRHAVGDRGGDGGPAVAEARATACGSRSTGSERSRTRSSRSRSRRRPSRSPPEEAS